MGTIHSQLSVLTASLCLYQTKTAFIFLLEEGSIALLHHLPKLLAETVVFVSGSGLGCWLVVAIVQPTQLVKTFSKSRATKTVWSAQKILR